MDFLQIFPDEICEKIFGYLAPKDVFEASMVSKNWYERIGRSKASMKKLTLAYYGDLDKDVNPVLNSKRAYTKVKFLVKGSKFKESRRIENIFRLILNKFSDSITNLETSHDTKRTSLPKLKEILFHYDFNFFHPLMIYKNGLLSTSNVIENFGIICFRIEENSQKILKTFLQNLTKLRVFTLSYSKLLEDWKDWFNLQFKLEQFNFLSRTSNCPPYVHEFLLAHNTTLKIIDVSYPTSNLLISILSDFPQLRTLKYKRFVGASKPYPVNRNITTLILKNTHMGLFDTSDHFNFLFPALPNLQVLKVFDVLLEIITHAYVSQSLKKLVYSTISDAGLLIVTYIEMLLSNLSRRAEVIQSNEL